MFIQTLSPIYHHRPLPRHQFPNSTSYTLTQQSNLLVWESPSHIFISLDVMFEYV